MTDAAAEPNPLERTRKALKDGGLTQALAATEIGISDSALEGLRSLNDATGTGLALVGSDLLYERLTGGLRVAEFAQLFSRIGKRVRLPAATSEDADALLAAWGVEGKAERELARGIANKPGGLRRLSHTLGLASVFAGDKAVSAEHLRAELGKIHIGKKQLFEDDGAYRDMLEAVAGVRSAAVLDEAGRRKVLEHMRA